MRKHFRLKKLRKKTRCEPRATLPTRYAHARAQQMLETPETVRDGKIETCLKPVPIPCFGWSLKLISLKIADLKK